MSLLDWDAFVESVGDALGAFDLNQALSEDVHEVPSPRPPPLPFSVDDDAISPLGVATGPRARRRPRGSQLRAQDWSVPAVGEVEARQAAGAEPRAQLVGPAPEVGYRDWQGRVHPFPPLESVKDPGLRRALLLEQKRVDNEPGPGEEPPPPPPPLPPGEATVRLQRPAGEPTLLDAWEAAGRWKAAADAAHGRVGAYRAWATREGFRLSRWKDGRRGFVLVALTARAAERIQGESLEADCLAELHALLVVRDGPRAEPASPPKKKRQRKPKNQAPPAQLALALGVA